MLPRWGNSLSKGIISTNPHARQDSIELSVLPKSQIMMRGSIR
jgi:hypothetical protein